jgi:hypothetical protein
MTVVILFLLGPMFGPTGRPGGQTSASPNVACPCGCKTTCTCCCRKSQESKPAPRSSEDHSPDKRCFCDAGSVPAQPPPPRVSWRPEIRELSTVSMLSACELSDRKTLPDSGKRVRDRSPPLLTYHVETFVLLI